MPDDLQREIFGGSDDDDLSSEEGMSFGQTGYLERFSLNRPA
jgi:hypothetical protein